MMKATSYYINNAIIDVHRQTVFNKLYIMVPYVDIIGLCHSVTISW